MLVESDRFTVEGRSAPEELLNPVIRHLASHASVRRYRPDPLPEGALEILVTAAQSASTSSNLQNYSIIAVESAERRERLAELTRNDHVRQAPLFLVFCPDLHRLERVAAIRGHAFNDRKMEMFLQAVVDAALAGQNAAVAAESLGLGICFIGGIRNRLRDVAELLQLPPRTFALFGMTVGYPEKPSKVKPRLPLRVILHREQYSDEGLEEGIEEYDRTMAATGVYKGRQVQTAGSEALDPAAYGWSEHSARRMARPSPERAEMKAILESLGWEF